MSAARQPQERGPFEPVDGRSRKDKLLDLFASKDYGDVITFEELDECLGEDFRKKARSEISRVRKILVETHRKALKSVHEVGYQIAQPSEQIGLARQQQRKARRAVSYGVALVENVAAENLTPTQQAKLDEMAHVMRRQEAALRRVGRRVETVEKGQRKLDDRVSVIEGLLRRDGLLHDPKVIQGELIDDPDYDESE